jgi:preprotein translocase subunit SecF
MFIFPKFLLQYLGIFLGYIFNIGISLFSLVCAITSFSERDYESFFVTLIVGILLSTWTIYLIRSGYLEHKKQEEQKKS